MKKWLKGLIIGLAAVILLAAFLLIPSLHFFCKARTVHTMDEGHIDITIRNWGFPHVMYGSYTAIERKIDGEWVHAPNAHPVVSYLVIYNLDPFQEAEFTMILKEGKNGMLTEMEPGRYRLKFTAVYGSDPSTFSDKTRQKDQYIYFKIK